MERAIFGGTASEVSIAGPPLTISFSAAQLGLPSSIAASGSATSSLIQTFNMPMIAMAAQLANAGTVTVQRFLDLAGQIPQGAPIVLDLPAATVGVSNTNDGLPHQSLKITINNGAASAAALSNVLLLLSA
jgi:hypothetical protein